MTAGDGVVRVAVEIAAPVDDVWAWLTEPARIPRWFGWEHDALEGEIDALLVDGVAKSRTLLRFGTNGAGVFRLEELGDLTRVSLARRADELDPESPFDGLDEGWTTFLHTLRLGLERHPHDERRALGLQGPLRAPDAAAGRDGAAGRGGAAEREGAAERDGVAGRDGGPMPGRDDESPRDGVGDPTPVRHLLGLDALDGLAPGEPYVATVAGEELRGEVWFRSPHQLGLTVDGWGDGLLVVVDQPADDARPHGGGQLLLSTYGLDDIAFARVFERWTGWARGTFAG